jgi:hypothetical protein
MANGDTPQVQAPDYASLAKQAGATGSQPAPAKGGPVDYAALAKQAGATSSQPAPASQDTGVWAGVKRNTVGMVTGLYHAFTDPPTDQEKAALMQKVQAEKDFQTAHGWNPDDVPATLATDPSRVTLAYHRLIDAPADQLQQKGTNEVQAAQDLMTNKHAVAGALTYLSGRTDQALSAVPMVGPWINSVADRAQRGDISGAATDLASAVTLGNAPEIVKATGLSKGAADLLNSSAAKNYQDVLNPTKVTTKYQTQKIMPQMLEEKPVAMTRQGLADKAAANAETAGQQIESTVSNLQGTMKTQPVIDGLQNLKKSFQVSGVSLRPEVDNAIDAVSDQMKQIGSDISLQDAVKARRILDGAVAEVGGYQGKPLSDTSLANVRKEAANSIRSELGQASPDLAAVNAKFHFWNTLSDVLDATIQRKTGQVGALSKVETVVAGAGGLAKSGLSGAAGYAGAVNLLGKAFRSTGWRTLSAATKSSIADALTSGDFDKVISLVGKTGIVGQMTTQPAAQNSNGYAAIGAAIGGQQQPQDQQQ